MSPAAAGGEPLRFRGGPLRVAALVPGRGALGGAAGVRLTRSGARQGAAAGTPLEVEPVVIPLQDQIQLRFPRATPPGTYQGVLTLDGAERQITAEVEPQVYLQGTPRRLELSGQPRGHVAVELQLMNGGNVAVEVPPEHTVELFDESAVEGAFCRAAGAELRPGERRIDRFADALAELCGGPVRVAADAGKGAVQPGETRTLRLSLAIPERLKPGHTYSGSWELHNLHCPIRITVTGGASAGKGGAT
ncbi:MAG TPA: hypothetical protein VFJ16_14870 [Longimicrobium sp.]|nr:hypothetical protein [Longimicrobium sp.]